MSERWRKMPGWPYEASDEAEVRRVGDSRPLTPTPDKDGYGRVTLYRVRAGKRERKTFGVHQVVALAWHGPPEVMHLDGDEANNRPGNLAYGSRRDNERMKRSGSTEAGRPRLMGLGGLEETEEKIGRVVSRPLTAVSPVAGELA
jgi:hypothetical protein